MTADYEYGAAQPSEEERAAAQRLARMFVEMIKASGSDSEAISQIAREIACLLATRRTAH